MKHPFKFKKDSINEGVLDFSGLLDAPAGKYGFITIRDGHFFAGSDRIRFYGFNIAFHNLMSGKEDFSVIADRLAHHGVNFVRIHAEDFIPRHGEDSLIDYRKGHSRSFNQEKWDGIDFLIDQLKKKGIYIQLDLFCYRGFLPGDDLDYPDDMMKYHKQANVFNRRLIELQKEYATAYLTHFNAYTGLRYVDDPAIAIVQVMNEDGIFWYEGRDLVGLPSYRQELDQRFNHWLLAKYGSRQALALAWTDAAGSCALRDDEDPAVGSVRRIPHLEGTQMYIDQSDEIVSPARYSDYTKFLTGIQLDFAREMRSHLLSIGVRCPINITNHAQGAADIYSIDRYADVNQDNAYWNHPDTVRQDRPRYHSINMVENDPRQTIVDSPFKLNLVTRLNHDRVVGKPFIAAEWNILYGTDFRSDGLPMVAAYACLQDWDGMVLYAYNHGSDMQLDDDTRLNGPFDLYNDPATWGQIGLCSYLFQKGLVQQGRNQLEICYSEDDLYAVPRSWITPYGYTSYISRVAARFIGLQYQGHAQVAIASGHTPTGDYRRAEHAFVYARQPYIDGAHQYNGLNRFLTMHRQTGDNIKVLDEEASAMLEQSSDAYSQVLDQALKDWGLLRRNQGLIDNRRLVSDTDELDFDFGRGRFAIETPQLKTISGQIKGEIKLGQYVLQINNEKMTVSLLSLDGKPTDESSHLLLVALGWCGNQDMVFEQDPDGSRVLVSSGDGPVMIDALEGVLEAPAPVRLWPLSPEGKRLAGSEELKRHQLENLATMYVEIERS